MSRATKHAILLAGALCFGLPFFGAADLEVCTSGLTCTHQFPSYPCVANDGACISGTTLTVEGERRTICPESSTCCFPGDCGFNGELSCSIELHDNFFPSFPRASLITPVPGFKNEHRVRNVPSWVASAHDLGWRVQTCTDLCNVPADSFAKCPASCNCGDPSAMEGCKVCEASFLSGGSQGLIACVKDDVCRLPFVVKDISPFKNQRSIAVVGGLATDEYYQCPQDHTCCGELCSLNHHIDVVATQLAIEQGLTNEDCQKACNPVPSFPSESVPIHTGTLCSSQLCEVRTVTASHDGTIIHNSSDKTVGLVIGISAAIAAVVMIGLVAFVIVRNKRKQKLQQEYELDGEPTPQTFLLEE